jgi:phosphoribosylformylglycinamidine synthase
VPPALDLRREAALQRVLINAAADAMLVSAHDVSAGGLAVCVAEASLWGDIGAELQLAVAHPPAVALFSESPSRAIVSVNPARWPELARLAAGQRVACRRLGTVGGERLRIRLTGVGATGAAEERGAGVADELDVAIADLRRAWTRGLPRALGEA